MPPGGVRMVRDEPEAVDSVLRRLAVFMQRFSPVVAVDADDAMLLDITGCARVFGGEQRLMDRAARALRGLGLATRAAIAPTFACAGAVARFGEARSGETINIVPEGGQREAIAPLPIRALGVEESAARALSEVGIELVGQLMSLPRSSLPSRFGSELLWRLDCALGEAMETIEPVRAEPPPSVERLFDGMTTRADAIEAATRSLLDLLTRDMRSRGIGARRMELTLLRPGATPMTLAASFGRPSRDPSHLWTILRPGLERANLGFGVEGVRIVAVRTGRLGHEQLGEQSGVDADPKGVSELVDALAARLGRRAVLRVVAAESHLPERTARLIPADAASSAPSRASIADACRPTQLFERPEPASVVSLTPDGPVMHVAWRGGSSRVTACVGPERISPAWWDSRPGLTRDYFRVRDGAGRWIWLCRAVESGRWFVHGVWA